MSFTFRNTDIKDLLIITPHLFEDERGMYKKYYEKEEYLNAGVMCEFTESSDISSTQGALRGLHYQQEFSQAKLIHVVYGTIFDVALDIRRDSDTFGKYHTEILTAEENKVIFIPEGFAHGFITLTDSAVFSYMCSGRYAPDFCGGILWNDPELNIPWPLGEYGIEQVICTQKDKNWPTLKQYCEKFC